MSKFKDVASPKMISKQSDVSKSRIKEGDVVTTKSKWFDVSKGTVISVIPLEMVVEFLTEIPENPIERRWVSVTDMIRDGRFNDMEIFDVKYIDKFDYLVEYDNRERYVIREYDCMLHPQPWNKRERL